MKTAGSVGKGKAKTDLKASNKVCCQMQNCVPVVSRIGELFSNRQHVSHVLGNPIVSEISRFGWGCYRSLARKGPFFSCLQTVTKENRGKTSQLIPKLNFYLPVRTNSS